MKLTVLGSGESAMGTVLLARKKGLEVFLSDYGLIDQTDKDILNDLGAAWEEGGHSDKVYDCDEVVKSPGIPDTVPVVKKLKEKGVSVISEIEFAWRYINGKTIGITGTNGKTTTTLLTHHILSKAGIKAGLVGNIGKSFARQVAEEECDWYVIELSSFQLDGIVKYRPDIAILLNITPDHLERYNNDFSKYVISKFRITLNQLENDHFIYCADDKVINDFMDQNPVKGKKLPISLKEQLGDGAFVRDNKININLKNDLFDMSIHDLAIQGKHNTYNSMAAGIAAKVIEIRKEVIRESLSDFQNAEHRLEFVAKIHGIEFINDSKATNINATWYALESMSKSVVWIMGGVDKGNDYSELSELVSEKVKAIVCLGTQNAKIHAAFDGIVENVVDAGSAMEAVAKAYRLAKKGDAVLLSPACASFDLFENFEDRGHQFKRAVRSL